MPDPIKSDRHGLSVHTTADAAPDADTTANRRLRRPVGKEFRITNTFNDATSGHLYDQRAGHEGIDFGCGTDTPVNAMYSGVVVAVVNNWQSDNTSKLGNRVTIRSYTDPTAGTGFEHTYAHLQSVAHSIEIGTYVQKGEEIGRSGDSGTYMQPATSGSSHLHVHLKAFGAEDVVTGVYDPPKKDNSRLRETVTVVAQRIGGCMNYACFLPPDSTALPAIDMEALRHTGKLLSPRDAYANIPVYSERSASSEHLGTIKGKQLGCYAILAEYPSSDNPAWYQIQYRDSKTGWVSRTGPVGAHNVVWVQVEAAPAPGPIGNLSARVSEVGMLEPPGTVQLHWEAPTEGGPVTGYQIRRGVLAWYLPELVADTGSTATSWTDTNAPPSRTYYAVAALSGKVQGPVSDIAYVNVAGQAIATLDAQTAGQSAEAREGPYDASATNGNRILADASFPLAGRLQPDWLLLGPQSQAATGRNPQTAAPTGWVPSAIMRVSGDLATVPEPPYLRLASWVMLGANVRSGPDKAYDPPLQTLTDHGIWCEITGKNAAAPTWWRIRVEARTHGWIYADLVDTRGDLSGVPVQAADSPVPGAAGPAGEAATGTGSTAGSAAGDFRNLVTNPDGRWAVWKSGTTVTANFSSPRSPVQYYARQHPQPQFGLPVGFRPTRPVTHTVTGTRVNADRTPVAHAQPAPFDLTVGTNGEMRYVDNAKVDDLGYVSYSVTHLRWQTDEALVAPSAPAGRLSATGPYLNQQVNWGSRWTLARSRSGTRVTGRFGSTRAPVDYYANGASRAAQLQLPAAYRPTADTRVRVRGAVRVNADGADSTDTRRVDFGLTVQANGEMWYDADARLQTLGVGYLRYTVDVAWTAAPLVPTAPRELETDDVAATTLELDWRAPAEDGGASITGYRVEVYRNGSWRTAEDDISGSRHTLENLDPYTTYTWRVRARNSAGWSESSPGVTVATQRAVPGAPASLSATATHDTVTLTWGATSGTVTGHILERKAGNSGWRTLVDDTGETTRAWEDRTVAAATAYRYRVAAHNHNVTGRWSDTCRVTTAATPTMPGMPTGLSVAPGSDRRLQLTWAAPTDTGGGVTGYRVERSPDETPRMWRELVADTGSAALTWGDDDPAPDTVYHYRVRAQNSAGVGRASAEAMGRARPQLPLAAAAVYPLTAHTEPRPDAAVTATFAAYLPGRSYDLVAQVPGTEGWWRVLLFEQSTPGPFWLPAAAGVAVGDTAALPRVPGRPRSLTAVPGGGTVVLAWRAPAPGGTVTGYRLWRRTGSAAFAPLGTDLGATVLTHTDTTARADTDYAYRVQALSAVSPGPWTDAISTAEPNAPTALAATPTLDSQMTLTWTAPTTGSPVTGYRIERAPDTTPRVWTDAAAHTGNTSVTWSDRGLTAATVHHYRVTAHSAAGLGTASTVVATRTRPQMALLSTAPYPLQARAWPATEAPVTHTWDRHDATVHLDVAGQVAGTGGWWRGLRFSQAARGPYWLPAAAVTVTGATPHVPAAPGRPTALAATATHDSVTLTWTAPTTGGTVTGYRLWRQTGTAAWTVLRDGLPATPRAYTDTGLASVTPYRYRLQARSAAGAGPRTAAVRATTAAVRVPDAPTALAAVPGADSQMVLTWTAPGETGTHALAGYRIERAVEAVPRVWTDAVAHTGNTDLAWSDRGLAADTLYHYRVRAVSAAGEGPPSTVAAGRTRPQMALQSTAPYPLQARAWPAPEASITHTWAAHDATAKLDVVGRVSGTDGWWRGLRFGRSASGPYWVSAAAVTVTGGTVTGYRLWRQTGAEAFAVLGSDLAAAPLTHTDTAITGGTAYQYRLQALSAAGAGPRTPAVRITPAAVTPRVRNYGPGSHTIDIPAGHRTLYVQLCGGAGGGATDEDDPDDGRNGTASLLRRNGTLVATGDYGRGGAAAVGWNQRAAAGATTGDSAAWPAAWPGDAPAPVGGDRGPWFLDRPGSPGEHGRARILLV